MEKKLIRSNQERILGGVCGGLGVYFNIDPTIIRLAWAMITVFTAGAGLLAYFIAWIIVPEET